MKQIYAVVVIDGESKKVAVILEAIQPLIKRFEKLFPEELPAGLPPMPNIQHAKGKWVEKLPYVLWTYQTTP